MYVCLALGLYGLLFVVSFCLCLLMFGSFVFCMFWFVVFVVRCGCSLFGLRYSMLFAFRCSLFVVRGSLFVVGCWLSVVGC